MLKRGLATKEEIGTGRMNVPPLPVTRVLKGEMVPAFLARGEPVDRPPARPSRFKPGDKVRTRNMNPEGHTRLPRYARGRAGEIARVHGTHVFPDSSAHGLGDDPQWLYSVRFSAAELWGHDSCDSMHIDLWEPYLEASP
jgi:nitrile hydratase